jgi:hypothetical protein
MHLYCINAFLTPITVRLRAYNIKYELIFVLIFVTEQSLQKRASSLSNEKSPSQRWISRTWSALFSTSPVKGIASDSVPVRIKGTASHSSPVKIKGTAVDSAPGQ